MKCPLKKGKKKEEKIKSQGSPIDMLWKIRTLSVPPALIQAILQFPLPR